MRGPERPAATKDGRHLAMALALGADGVWVGTRFVASVEGGAPQGHKDATCPACEGFRADRFWKVMSRHMNMKL